MKKNNIVKYVQEFFKHNTNRNAIIIFCARIISSGLGLLATFIIAREIGLDDFGKFFFSITGIALISELIGNCVNTTFIRFYSSSLEQNENKGDWVLRFSLKANVIIGVIIGIGCYILAEPIAIKVLGKPDLVTSIRFIALGCLGFLIWGFMLSIYYARQLFMRSAILEIGYNIIKFTFIVFAVIAHALNLVNALIIFVVAPYLCMLATLKYLPINSSTCRTTAERFSFKKEGKELFHFNKWLLLSSVCYAIYSRLSFFLLSHFGDAHSLSLFSAAFNLSLGVDLLTGVSITVLLPKISKLTKREEFIYFIKHFLMAVIPLSLILMGLAFIFAKPLIVTIYTEEFIGAIPAFIILIIGTLLVLMFAPLSLIFYALNIPKYLTYIDVFVLVISVLSGLWIIPSYGIIGAALVSLITKFFLVSGILFFLFMKLYPDFRIGNLQETGSL